MAAIYYTEAGVAVDVAKSRSAAKYKVAISRTCCITKMKFINFTLGGMAEVVESL